MEINSILPDDLFEEILLRLPVIHLLRLKCVCKHWYALIGDYSFHKKHYHFQYAMHVAEHEDIPLFLDHPPLFREEFFPSQFYLLSKHQGTDVVLNVTPDLDRDVSAEYANDPEICNLAVRCMGVVNGVVGLQWGTKFFSWDRYRLALWNPATREFKNIPRWPIVSDTKNSVVTGAQILGLGFDFESADFKILGLTHFARDDDISNRIYDCQLYSLRSNSWKKIETPNSFLSFGYSGMEAQLNNVCYWLAYNQSRDFRSIEPSHRIISFNFSTEIYKDFELPEGVMCPHKIQHIRSGDGSVTCDCFHEWTIGKYKDDLALFVNASAHHADWKVEIWVVTKFRDDDNEVPLSWKLVLRIGLIHSFHHVWFLKVRVCGDLLLAIQQDSWDDPVKCIYDPSTRIFNFSGLKFSSSFSYVESLFFISGLN